MGYRRRELGLILFPLHISLLGKSSKDLLRKSFEDLQIRWNFEACWGNLWKAFMIFFRLWISNWALCWMVVVTPFSNVFLFSSIPVKGNRRAGYEIYEKQTALNDFPNRAIKIKPAEIWTGPFTWLVLLLFIYLEFLLEILIDCTQLLEISFIQISEGVKELSYRMLINQLIP